MAYEKYRIRRKTDSGYDVLHVETRSSLVLRFNDGGVENGTVEETLRSIESSLSTMSTSIENLTKNQESTGTNVTAKADKVVSATNGNFAGLDANGNLTDSGKKASDFAAAEHEHDGGDVKIGTASRVVGTDASGYLTAITSITLTELGYLAGVTGKIQTQLDGKASTGHNHDSAYLAASKDSTYEKVANKGVANGYVPLNSEKKIDATYLPSYVDDVIEGTLASSTSFKDTSGTAVTGETGKIYVDTATNKTYRWSGSQFTEISQSITVTKSSNNGAISVNGSDIQVYTHPAYTAKASGFYKVTVDAQGHVSAVTAVEAADITSALGYTPLDEADAYVHPTTAGNKHIPAGGSSGQILRWSAAGTAAWGAETTYTHPSYTTQAAGFYKITVDATGHVSAVTAVTAADIKALTGIDMTGATSSAAGTHGMVPAPAAGAQAKFLRGDGTWQTPTDNDTKNTAGSTDSSAKLFLIGAASQAANPQTYSHDTCYIGTDGRLYSGSRLVIDVQFGTTQPTNQATNDLWFEELS